MEEQPSPDTATLELAVRYFEGVRDAARNCVDNFSWLMAGGDKIEYIPCLDFDVIAAALFDTSESSRSKGAARELPAHNRTTKPLEIDLRSLAGPAVLEFFARRMKQIALPSGAMAELLAFKERLRFHASGGARSVLKILGDLQTPGAAERKLGELRAIPISEQFMTAVQELVASSRRLGFVNALVDRAQPLERIAVEVRDEHGLAQTFQLAYRHLMFARPDYSRSNFFDAWNCAEVVKANESPVRLAVLVTNTMPVVRAFGILDTQRFVGSSLDKRRIVADLRFMVLFENLLEKSGSLSGAPPESVYRAARTEAWSLFTEASALARRVDSCRVGSKANKLLDDRKRQAVSTHNWVAGLDMILTAYPEFQQRWGGLVGRFDQVYKQDAAMMMARIDTPRVRWWMDHVSEDDRARLVRALEQRLEQIKVGEDNRASLLKLCYELGRTSDSAVGVGVGDAGHGGRILHCRQIDNKTSRLSEIRFSDPEPPRLQGELEQNAASANRRFASFVPAAADEPCFVLDSWTLALDKPHPQTLVSLSFVPAEPAFAQVWAECSAAFARMSINRQLTKEQDKFVHRITGDTGHRIISANEPLHWDQLKGEISSTPTDVAVFYCGHALSLTTGAGISGEYRVSYTFPLENGELIVQELAGLVTSLGWLKLPIESLYLAQLRYLFNELRELSPTPLGSRGRLSSRNPLPAGTRPAVSGDAAAAADRHTAKRGLHEDGGRGRAQESPEEEGV